jgi:hypothetical protein
MPYAGGTNRSWLRSELGHRVDLQYVGRGEWEIARAHLRELIEACAERFGEVDVILDFRARDRCDARCRDAVGDDCVCSCLGENHGGAAYWKRWVPVGETTLIDDGRIVRRRLRAIRGVGLIDTGPLGRPL